MFPQDDPNELLDRAEKYVNTRATKLRDVIERAGAGCDPHVVVTLVQHVRAVNFR